MEAPAELMNSPTTINQNWEGYSAIVLRRRVSIVKKIRDGTQVSPLSGLVSGTATVIAAAAVAPIAARALS